MASTLSDEIANCTGFMSIDRPLTLRRTSLHEYTVLWPLWVIKSHQLSQPPRRDLLR